jgi:hypothetical protein
MADYGFSDWKILTFRIAKKVYRCQKNFFKLTTQEFFYNTHGINANVTGK